MKLYPKSDLTNSDKIFDLLQESFGEKRSVPQLLKAFYDRRQREGETLRAFSHALRELQAKIEKKSVTKSSGQDAALRDHFAENVRDPLLRKELKKFIRTHPEISFLDTREEAIRWPEEDERSCGPRPRVASSHENIHVHCLLDSGSQVSTITESFFTNHFRPRRSKLLDINQWVTLTAANGLEIPYIGYLELDFEAQGVTIPNRGVLVVRDPPDPQSRARKEAVPGLIGMNIIQRKNQEIKEPKLLEDSAWTNTLQAAGKAMTSVRGFAKIAGKSDVRIPAGMVTTVDATGYRGSQPGEDHPRRPRGSRVIMSTLSSVSRGRVKVQVANIAQEDVWLRPRERIGIMHAVAGVQDDNQAVIFFSLCQ
ncbi:unnamed protein product [Porites lobata]|uniref:Peptidase A2 domain-containing protein n=1 Tax=Porites lobata TaxID=104759 RepID=A0ABN8PKZ3_9CNID|nr:unnamed protein product [Porites lobata]